MVSGAHIVQDTIRSLRRAQGAFDRARIPRTTGALARVRAVDPRDYAAFPCYRLCMECGYLDDPVAADPNRTVAGPPGVGHTCPKCQQPAITDLGHTPTVLALAQVDEHDAPARASSARRTLVRMTGVGALVGVAAMIGYFLYTLVDKQGGIDPFYFLLWFGSLMPFLFTARALQRQMAERSTAKRMPARWRMPAPVGQNVRARAVQRGPVRCEQEIVAPLTGRPCVAYEVAVRRDPDPDAPLGTWLLLEQRNTEIAIADETIAVDTADLQLLRTRYITDPEGPDPADVFLRQRGLMPTEDVVLYETIIEEGAVCEVRGGSRGIPVVSVRQTRALPEAA